MSGGPILFVDDAAGPTELLAELLRSSTGSPVATFSSVEGFLAAPIEPWSVAIVDMSFRGSQLNGADVLLRLHREAPNVGRLVYSQGDDWVADLLRDTWEAIPIQAVLSKGVTATAFVDVVRRVLAGERSIVDPVLAPLLPASPSPWRTLDGYGRLVVHAGHAKLWQALIDAPTEPSYRELGSATGLSVNSVRNYRDQLLAELRLHGLDAGKMRHMHVFARRCRPFLAPFIAAKLGPPADRGQPAARW